MKYCSFCGTQLSDADRFCPECGTPCAGAPNTGSLSVGVDLGASDLPANASKKRTKKRKWFWFLMPITLLIAGGLAAYLLLSPKNTGWKVVKKTVYYSSSVVSDWETYEYDSNGFLVKTINHYNDGHASDPSEFPVGTTIVYENDKYGRCVRESWDDMGDPREYMEYEYDDAGHLLKEITYYPSGEVKGWWYEYTYDQNGNRDTSTCHAYEEISVTKYINTYDPNGNLLTVTEIASDGNKHLKAEYSYDSENRMLSETDYTVGRIYKTYQYDEEGNLVREDTDANSNLSYEILSYDRNHNITKKEFYRDGSLDSYYSYEYDEHGNMTREEYGSGNGKTYWWRVYEYQYLP